MLCYLSCTSDRSTTHPIKLRTTLIVSLLMSPSSQDAAMALESAFFLCHLLSKVTSRTQVAPVLQVWNKQRELRVRKVIEGSQMMGRFWHSPNTAALPEASRPKNVLADPRFQMWLLGYDAGEDAERAWEAFQISSLNSKF